MPCEPYKRALSEAASGGAASAALRSHLMVCTDCRTALAAEEALFAAIDAGLRAAANSEAPPTLLPGLRARLVDGRPHQTRWPLTILIPAAAALVLAVVLVHGMRRSNVQPIRAAHSDTAASAIAPPVEPAHPSSRPAEPRVSPASSQSVATKTTRRSGSPSAADQTNVAQTFPEILVPPEQVALVVRYAEEWRTRKYVRLSAALFPRATMQPMELTPIQIDAVDVKSLAELGSQ